MRLKVVDFVEFHSHSGTHSGRSTGVKLRLRLGGELFFYIPPPLAELNAGKSGSVRLPAKRAYVEVDLPEKNGNMLK